METSSLSFARPVLLNALWLLPLVVALFWWAEQRRRSLIGRIVAPKLRALLAGNTSPARRWFRAACVLGALGLLVVTMAGPRLGYDTLEVPHKGRDVIIAMDVSRSMLATDVAPTRLQRAKLLAEDLISELGGDRLGLVAFAGSAFLQAPLTLDHGAVLTAVDELDTDLIPKGGSNLAAAIRTCEEAFGKAEGFSRAIVIISDGEELDADGLEAARQAAADGIRIFTVGVGSEEGSEIPLGPGEFVRDPSGKIVQSRLDAARMREIAEATGGFYVPLDENAARQLAVEGIGEMKEVEMSASTSRRPIERYQWPLAGAIGLLVLQALVGERRRRPVLAATLWLLSCLPAWSAPSGLTAYEQGNYEQARSAFEERLKMEPGAPGLQLNAGTAAYRLKDYGKASEYFSRAMLSDDPALRSSAEFNLGNTLFRQGEGQQDKEKKITDWKDAIAKYEAALKTRPDYTEAKENKERVEELLKQAEQEQSSQDQKKDEQNKDQQQKQDQQQGDQKKDQQQQQGGQQDKEQQDQGQQEKKDQQQQGQQKKQEQQPSADGGQDQKDQQSGQQKDGQQGDEKKDQQEQQGGQQDKDQQGQGQQQKQDEQQGGEEKKDQRQQGGKGEQEGEQKGEDSKEQGQQGESDKQKDQQQQGGQQDKQQEGESGEKEGEQQGQGREGHEPKDEGSGEDQKGESEPSRNGSSGQARQEPGEGGEQPAPVPQQAGDKKEGELRAAAAAGQGEGKEEAAVAAAEAEEEVEGQMSASQARALLRSLQSEEEQVDLSERRNFQDVSRDW